MNIKMKALIQRAMKASVSVGGEVVSSIDRGLCVLIGISSSDTKKDMEYIVRKILAVRLFDDAAGKRWSTSVADNRLELLCVSQFTLCATLKGNKPDYHAAMPADRSEQFYNEFLAMLRKSYKPELVKDGVFGAYMQVSIQNDGPVTIEIQSPQNATGEGAKRLSNRRQPNNDSEIITNDKVTESGMQTLS